MQYEPQEIIKRIRKLRCEAGLSQEKFAEVLGISASYYQKFEQGQRDITLPVLIDAAEYFNLSLDYIVTGKGIKEALGAAFADKLSDITERLIRLNREVNRQS